MKAVLFWKVFFWNHMPRADPQHEFDHTGGFYVNFCSTWSMIVPSKGTSKSCRGWMDAKAEEAKFCFHQAEHGQTRYPLCNICLRNNTFQKTFQSNHWYSVLPLKVLWLESQLPMLFHTCQYWPCWLVGEGCIWGSTCFSNHPTFIIPLSILKLYPGTAGWVVQSRWFLHWTIAPNLHPDSPPAAYTNS